MSSDHAGAFEMAHCHVDVPAVSRLHGQASSAERCTTLISEELQDGGAQAHANRYTLRAVRQASQSTCAAYYPKGLEPSPIRAQSRGVEARFPWRCTRRTAKRHQREYS